MPALAAAILLQWQGENSLEIDEEENLLIHHTLGTLMETAPFAYQETGSEQALLRWLTFGELGYLNSSFIFSLDFYLAGLMKTTAERVFLPL